MANKLIELQGISKSFDNELIIDDLNLYINENRFLTLLGPSGCGIGGQRYYYASSQQKTP